MEFHTQLIKDIKSKISTLPTLNEHNIKNHVVIDVFLEQLGYSRSMCNFEQNCRNDFVDFAIKISENKSLYVEIKNGYNDLKDENIAQLLKYINLMGGEWGILSNGFRYILVNNNIKSLDDSKNKLADKIVFDISINKTTDIKYLKYFSKEKIFEDKTTYYFVHIAQFRNYKIWTDGNSWASYKSTLFNFFDFYADKKGYKVHSNDITEPLTKIDIEDYFDFIKFKMNNQKNSNKQLKSKETINNSYSYFTSFFNTLKKYSYISDHNFKYSRKEILAKYEDTPKMKREHYLTDERFQKILEYIYSHNNSDRNIVIFLLCAYYGIERSCVDNLKLEQIDMEQGIIKFGKTTIKINSLMLLCLNNIMKKQNIKKKNEFVLLKCCKNSFEKATFGIINLVFNDLQNIDKLDKTWKCFSPQYVRDCLIKEMFKSGYLIEQIVYETNLNLPKLSSYISHEDIFKQGKQRANNKIPKPVHPYENVVNNFFNVISECSASSHTAKKSICLNKR